MDRLGTGAGMTLLEFWTIEAATAPAIFGDKLLVFSPLGRTLDVTLGVFLVLPSFGRVLMAGFALGLLGRRWFLGRGGRIAMDRREAVFVGNVLPLERLGGTFVLRSGGAATPLLLGSRRWLGCLGGSFGGNAFRGGFRLAVFSLLISTLFRGGLAHSAVPSASTSGEGRKFGAVTIVVSFGLDSTHHVHVGRGWDRRSPHPLAVIWVLIWLRSEREWDKERRGGVVVFRGVVDQPGSSQIIVAVPTRRRRAFV
mmetsp:Transcript_58128/g.173485  ORF Transcript_58128/g.173485 Transcript_58128/m.173485 type:complete len:254 (+) Transcript_58128:1785-2546(+)